MNSDALLNFYKLLSSDKSITLMGAIECGFDCKTAYALMRSFVLCGTLHEVERGVFSVEGAEDKLDSYMHSQNIWLDDNEQFAELKKLAIGLSAKEIVILHKCFNNGGAIHFDRNKEKTLLSLVDKGLVVCNKNNCYRSAVDLPTIDKLLELVKEKVREFVSYVIENVRHVIGLKLGSDMRKRDFYEHCEEYQIFSGLEIDPFDYNDEEIAGLSESEKLSLANLVELLQTTVAERNFMMSGCLKNYRYPDNEYGSDEIDDSLLNWVVEKMIRMIAEIKQSR